MDMDSWVERLRAMGFTNYEARVYLSLLGEESLTVADIVRKCGVPQPKIYEAARVLSERGFIERVLGGVQAFRAVLPEKAFDAHRHRVEQDLARQAKEMNALAAALPKTGKLAPDAWGVRVVQGNRNIRAVLNELSDKAAEIIQVVKPPLYGTARPDRLAAGYSEDVDFYWIGETSLLADPVHGGSFRTAGLEDARIRFVETLPSKYAVIDRKVVIMPVHDVDEGTALVIPHPGLAQSIAEWAIGLWQAAGRYRVQQETPVKRKR